MRSEHTISIAIIVGGLIVAFAVYFSVNEPAARAPSGQGNPALVRPVDATDHIIGNPRARVMIIEYSDYDCDWCKTFHEAMYRVITNRGPNGDVAWVYRHFPLTEIHQNARKHAQAAVCVAETGGNEAFWRFSDSLFRNQPTDPSRYGELAQAAGAPAAEFQRCYVGAAGAIDARITRDRENALAAGAVGTPYSVIVVDGKTPIVMDGAYTTDAIELIIAQVLAQ